MPIDPSVYTRASVDGPNRQCQHCFKAQTAQTGPLKSCSRCKRAHYCSRECQVADWPAHKERCKHNVDTMARLKAHRETATLPSGTDLSRVAADLKKWSQAHRPILTWAAMHALNVPRHPENCEKMAVLVQLLPAKKRAPNHFTLEDVFAVPMEDVRGMCESSGEMAQMAQIEGIIENSKELKRAGGTGIAMAIVLCGPITFIIPLGLADKFSGPKGYPYDPQWHNKLKDVVEGKIKI